MNLPALTRKPRRPAADVPAARFALASVGHSTAAATSGRLEAVSEEKRAQQLLRRLGVRTWRAHPPAQAQVDELTDRELAIAQLISNGASNPEIAETLFLSRKTLERHVSNVLAKTGSRNRAELAASRRTP
jgi:DNA-binding NarL/FixJ family response regulator